MSHENDEIIVQAEQFCLGVLLKGGKKAFALLEDSLTADDFLTDVHRTLFAVIAEQTAAGVIVDIVTINQTKQFEAAYLVNLLRSGCLDNLLLYAEQIKIAARERKFKALVNDVMSNKINQAQFLAEINHPHENATKKRKSMFTHISELQTKPLDWLIKDFVECNALVEVFGAPESGKSLLAIDWGLSVAAGIAWNGKTTQQGAVFYIAGEGFNGLTRRFDAWAVKNAVNRKDLPFYSSRYAAELNNPKSAVEVEEEINDIATQIEQPPRLIIVDTLARNFGGGNENSTEDMTNFIKHLDKHLRVKFNCTVLVVHHTGNNAEDRGRGSSALKAAVDTEYSMKKDSDKKITLTCTKMKDADHPLPFSFVIEPVEIGGRDNQGNPATGAVLQVTAYTPPPPKPKVLGKNQKAALVVLQELYHEARQTLLEQGQNPNAAKVSVKAWQETSGFERNRFFEAKKSLSDSNLIAIDGNGFVYLVEADTEAA